MSTPGPSRPPAAARPVAELSAFLPFYNEQENVEAVVEEMIAALDGLELDYELLLVDDGSADDTGRIADRIAADRPRVRVLRHERNLGYGAALQTGFRGARRTWVFYTDGDGQFDPADLRLLLPLADEYDIVSGYRLNRQDGFVRRVKAALWGLAVRIILGLRVRDVDSAFKLYRREIFDRIEMRSSGALIDAEILARARRAGYSIGQVGVRHRPRRAGRAGGADLRVALRALWDLLRLRRSIRATPKAR